MINNRQTGRRRGRGGGNGQQRPGGQGGNGSRIDNRARGNATQLHEKYRNMAADAQRAGDRVNTEYYLQFADHYFRVLSEQRGRFEDQPQRRGRDEFDEDGDGDGGGNEFGDEGEPIRGNEQGDGPRQDRDERRPNEARPNEARGEYRRDRDDGQGQGQGQGQRREWRERNERPDRGERRPSEPRAEFRNDRPREPEPVAGQHRADPVAADEPLDGRADRVLDADRPLDPPARRRGRPPRQEGDGGEPNGFEADRLPPALTVPANDEGGEVRPRRRRARPAEDTPPAAAE